MNGLIHSDWLDCPGYWGCYWGSATGSATDSAADYALYCSPALVIMAVH